MTALKKRTLRRCILNRRQARWEKYIRVKKYTDKYGGNLKPGHLHAMSLEQVCGVLDRLKAGQLSPIEMPRIGGRFRSSWASQKAARAMADMKKPKGTIYKPGSHVFMRDNKVYRVGYGGNLIFDASATRERLEKLIREKV